ncbi:MAG: hypothetical protein JWO13_550 [Acidobacteriales bacterium]|nr:hypothetical protein [Terriglobales bacterium]
MKSHSDLIKRIIKDLSKVDLVLMFQQPAEKNSIEEALLCELKSATDNLRTAMWCRMRAGETQEDETRATIQQYREQRVAKLIQQYPMYVRQSNAREGSKLGKFEEMANIALQEHLAAPTMQVN